MLTTAALFLGVAPAQAANFSGPRAEVRGGFDRVTLKLAFSDGVTSTSGKGHKDGYTLGGEVGYDGRISPNVTLGAYAGIDFPHTRVCDTTAGSDQFCLKAPRNLTAGVRLGQVIGRSALVYAKGGYSNGRLTTTYTDFTDATNNFSGHADRSGFHVGIGGEIAIASHAFVKAEIVHTRYNRYTETDATTVASLKGSRDQLLTGVGVRF